MSATISTGFEALNFKWINVNKQHGLLPLFSSEWDDSFFDQLQPLFYFKTTCNLACFLNLLVKISGQF